MIANSCCQYMLEKGYNKHWILPQFDLFQEDPDLKIYKGRPVENFPKLCCLDSNLNADIHKAINQHVRMSEAFDNNRPQIFLSSPQKRHIHVYETLCFLWWYYPKQPQHHLRYVTSLWNCEKDSKSKRNCARRYKSHSRKKTRDKSYEKLSSWRNL